MKAVVQRVRQATVTVDGCVVGTIGHGLLVLLGITHQDSDQEVAWLVRKLVEMRIFDDEEGKMNLSVRQVEGQVLVVSQFTLHAATRKGNRPSFIAAARPEVAKPLYHKFVAALEVALGKLVPTGQFGAMMEVNLVNDGPVTIILDSESLD